MAACVVKLGGLDRLAGVTRLAMWSSETVSVAVRAAVRTISNYEGVTASRGRQWEVGVMSDYKDWGCPAESFV